MNIEQEYFVAAPVAEVYRYLTEPNKLVRWFLASAKLRPLAGASYTFRWQGGYSHTAHVLEAVPNRRLSLEWPNRVGRTTNLSKVTFELRARGRGTLVRVTHRGFPSARAWLSTYGGTESGWAYFLTNLKSVLEHGHDLRSRYDG